MKCNKKVPLVSVVIPCFNSEKWVTQAIDSALGQDVINIEVVVVNDGSTDKTQQIIQGYGDRIVMVNQFNAGVSSARREGVRRSTGEYIKFLDSDDVLPRGALAALLSVAQKFSGNAILGRANVIGLDGYILNEDMYNLPVKLINMELVRYELLLTQATSSGLWLIPKKAINSDHFFDQMVNLGEEYKFCFELINRQIPVRFCDTVVYHARLHDSSARLSRSKNEATHLMQVDLVSTAVDMIQEKIHGYSQETMIFIARLCWSRGRDCLRISCEEAAVAYFTLAKKIQPKLRPVGSAAYQSVCRITGPVAAEKLMDAAKYVLNAWKF